MIDSSKTSAGAIVLLSGGMDSLVTAMVARRDCSELNLLHVSYGQRTQERELQSFRSLCEFFQPQRVLELVWNWLGEIGGSALTDISRAIPVGITAACVPDTYVPFRNANLLSAAVSWAETIGSKAIYIGAVEEDSSGYPDCREVFFAAFRRVIKTGSRGDLPLEVVTPVLHMSKAEIVRLGIELGAPFELSWSCYQNNDLACGYCESCRLRQKAFREAGYRDPIRYQGGN